MNSNLSTFPVVNCAFGINIKESIAYSKVMKIYLCFIQMFLVIIFKTSIHFESLIFVYGVK